MVQRNVSVMRRRPIAWHSKNSLAIAARGEGKKLAAPPCSGPGHLAVTLRDRLVKRNRFCTDYTTNKCRNERA